MWVFAMVDVSTTPATGFMQILPRRDEETLEGIIAAHLHDGSAVHSDQWAGYRHLCDLPQVREHRTVNHSEHFKDPATGVHTNHIESYWNRVKMNMKRMRGYRRKQLAGQRFLMSSCGESAGEEIEMRHSKTFFQRSPSGMIRGRRAGESNDVAREARKTL